MQVTINLPEVAADLLEKIASRYDASPSDVLRKALFSRYGDEAYSNQSFVSLFLSKEQSYKLSVISSHDNISVFKYFKRAIEEDYSYILGEDNTPE